MIKDRNVIIISSIDWDFNWQGPQEIASRLAEMGNRIFFIENTGVRAPKLKDAARMWKRITYWWSKATSNGFVEAKPNIFVSSPIVLPPFGSRLQSYINRVFLLPFIKKKAERLKMHDPLILTFLPTDTASNLIELLKSDKSEIVYYVAGDFIELVSDKEILIKSEKNVVEMCDAVITIVSSLTERYNSSHAKVYTLSYGVNLGAFRNGNHKMVPKKINQLVSKLKNRKKPVIGYVGGLHRYIDIDLLVKSAEKKNDWQWVFVGPIQENIADLEKLPNVSFLGQYAHEDLVYFIESFDVCIIPYTNVLFTQTVVPVKLNEYLAVGKPVVSTNIPAVQSFNEIHNVIRICENDPQSFLQAIEESLAEPETQSAVQKRKDVASLFDWNLHIKAVCQILNSISNNRENHKQQSISPGKIK